jgi:hypothetical protein
MMDNPVLKMWPPMDQVDAKFLTKRILQLQERIENHFFEARKSVLEYDDVLNAQREHVYGLRREVLLGKSIVLLLGGLLIGWLAGPALIAPLKPFFYDLFKGALCLFLLEMGLIVAARAGDLRQAGAFLIGFGLIMPLLAGSLGATVGWLVQLSVGGTALLAVLAASASYIAAPAAVRLALPQANPGISLRLKRSMEVMDSSAT